MQIEYKTGDLLKGPESHIVHGCNAQGVMRSGIAKQVREVYPNAYTAYRKTHDAEGLQVGQTIWANCKPAIEGYERKWVINAITQDQFGRDPNRVYASNEGIVKAIRAINAHNWMCDVSEIAQTRLGRLDRVGFPLIGAGLANGSWKIISAIIEEESTRFQPVVYLFDGVMPTS